MVQQFKILLFLSLLLLSYQQLQVQQEQEQCIYGQNCPYGQGTCIDNFFVNAMKVIILLKTKHFHQVNHKYIVIMNKFLIINQQFWNVFYWDIFQLDIIG